VGGRSIDMSSVSAEKLNETEPLPPEFDEILAKEKFIDR
jgi:hypothetical protein